MSFEASAIAFNHSRATGTTRTILLGIASHDGSGGAWPSIATLARYGNCSARNVQRSIAKLVELGEIRVHQQQGGNAATPDHSRPNLYEFLLTCPPDCDRTKNHRSKYELDPLTPTSPPDAHVTRPLTPTSPELPNNPPTTNRDSNKGSTVSARATVPAAPRIPRYQAPPARAAESVSDEQQAMNVEAGKLRCSKGLGSKARHLIPPRTGTSCAHCGIPAQTILEHASETP